MAKVSLADFTRDLPRESDTRRPAVPGGVRSLPIDEVATNPLNARIEADEDADDLTRLADTIAHRGVLQPIVVCTAAAFVEQYPDQETALGGAFWVTLIGNRRVVATRLAGRRDDPGRAEIGRVLSRPRANKAVTGRSDRTRSGGAAGPGVVDH